MVREKAGVIFRKKIGAVSAILIHLALDRFLTIRFAHIADVTQKKVKNASFIIIAIFTG